MQFPSYRPRRLRANETIRAMVRETTLSPADFIYPLFVKPGTGLRDEVSSMPGVFQLSLDSCPPRSTSSRRSASRRSSCSACRPAKDEVGSEAYDEHGIVQEAIRAIKAHDPEFYVITDVCMCEYTNHGHCGVLDERGCVINDVTLELLATRGRDARRGRRRHGRAQRHDGRPRGRHPRGARRRGLREHPDHGVLGEVRERLLRPVPRGRRLDAARSAIASSTRWTRPTPRRASARRALDIDEGADIVMVKPALAYMDMICRVKTSSAIPPPPTTSPASTRW